MFLFLIPGFLMPISGTYEHIENGLAEAPLVGSIHLTFSCQGWEDCAPPPPPSLHSISPARTHTFSFFDLSAVLKITS